MILDGRGQACPGKLKETIKISKNAYDSSFHQKIESV